MKRFFGYALVSLASLGASAQWANPSDDIPAFHSVPQRQLPPLLSGDQLSGPYFAHEYQVLAYIMAGKVPGVLDQLPCYCRCDRALGHKSLHSCFEGTHGAACSTCMREAFFAYQQTKLGKGPAQIRAAIERGEWENTDLTTAAL